MEEMNMRESTIDTIESEAESWTDSVTESGKDVLRTVEDGVNAVSQTTWSFMHDLPGHGAIIGGAVGLGAAMLVGVAELATGIFVGYVSYRVFAYGESWCEATENVIKFERGSLEKEELVKPVIQ
jgi:hypothetical protein